MLTIKRLLSTVLLVLIGLYTAAALTNIKHSIDVYNKADYICQINDISDDLYDAVQHFGFERGRVNVVLRDSGPVESMENNRVFIAKQRSEGEKALQNAITKINALKKDKFINIETSPVEFNTSVSTLRNAVDCEMKIPLTDRDNKLVARWFDTMTEFIDSLEELLFALTSDIKIIDGTSREFFTIKSKLLSLRNSAGPECSLVLSAYGTDGVLSDNDLIKVFKLEGVTSRLIQDIRLSARLLDNAALNMALKNFNTKYIDQFVPIQKSSLDAIFSKQKLPYEKKAYEKTMVDALNSIAPLMESAITTTNHYAMERLTFSKKSLSEAIFYSASFLAISIALFLYIKVKVSFRIKALSKTMSDLSNENDQDVPYSSDSDEIGDMARSVQVFKENIVKRKEADAQILKDLEDRKVLLDTIHLQVWYQLDESTYGAVNDSHATFLGKSKKEVEFKRIDEIFPHEVAQKIIEKNRAVIKGRRTINTEEWVRDGNNETRLLSVTKHPKFDKDGEVEYFIYSAEDITERRQAEIFRNDVEMIIRHDIKSPLAGLHSLASLALQEDIGDGLRNVAPLILNSIQQVINLVDSSDKLYKMECGVYCPKRMPFELPKVLGNVLQTLHSICIHKKITISSKCKCNSPDSCTVFGEKFLIENMLLNIVKNAVEASVDGSVVEVTCYVLSDCSYISVTNPGVINEDVSKKIFTKYFSYGKEHGTGLGTYSARLIAKSHGGDISFSVSSENKTTFLIELPLIPHDKDSNVAKCQHSNIQ